MHVTFKSCYGQKGSCLVEGGKNALLVPLMFQQPNGRNHPINAERIH